MNLAGLTLQCCERPSWAFTDCDPDPLAEPFYRCPCGATLSVAEHDALVTTEAAENRREVEQFEYGYEEPASLGGGPVASGAERMPHPTLLSGHQSPGQWSALPVDSGAPWVAGSTGCGNGSYRPTTERSDEVDEAAEVAVAPI